MDEYENVDRKILHELRELHGEIKGLRIESLDLQRSLWALLADVNRLCNAIIDALPCLTKIEIAFAGTPLNAAPIRRGETPMSSSPNPVSAPIAGPVILTTAGEQAIASILGFDQNGNPWTGTIPPVTFTSSDTAGAIVTSTPNADGVTDTVTAVGNGVASLTANLTTAEGLSLTDTETVTVTLTIAPPPPPLVLSSIKIAFAPA